MYPDYRKICEERYVVDRDPTNGRQMRYADNKHLKRWSFVFVLAPFLFMMIFGLYAYFFVLPNLGKGAGEAVGQLLIDILQRVDMRLSGH